MAIRILSPQVSERIAAGEVVERPSSVVKELAENSLDAGATRIAVMLEEGGRARIEVLDNGLGMGVEDLKLCIRRHATSKIATVEDLDSLKTMGFRGEALPSVAAVSDLTITSQQEGGPTHQLSPSVGFGEFSVKPITFGHFLGSGHGTQVRVESLFAQVPARLKFLKSPRAEVSAVRDVVERLALTRPDVGFKLVNQDKVLFDLPPQSMEERVKTILGARDADPLVQFEAPSSEFHGMGLKLYWLQGVSLPTTRKLYQVVNGRVLKDRLIQQSVLKAFKQTLLPGNFPAIVVDLSVSPEDVDVNVHPTKTEVRFTASDQIFKFVHRGVEKMILDRGMQVHVPSQARPPMQPVELPGFSAKSEPPRPRPEFRAPHPKTETMELLEPVEVEPPVTAETAPEPVNLKETFFLESQYLGALFATYLVYEHGQELILVDQHAAHERIRFEELKNQFEAGRVERQALLLPESLEVESENVAEVEARLPLLEKMGFVAERFGETDILFRELPSAWGDQSLRPRLRGLLERLLSADAEAELDEVTFEKLASEACHSAIRAGDRVEREEAKALMVSLFSCEHPWNCPHGRPTFVRIPEKRFEEWFQRQV